MPKELLTKRDIDNIRKHINELIEPIKIIEITMGEINLKYNNAVAINKAINQIKNSTNMIYNLLPYENHLKDLKKALREGIKDAN